MQTSIDQIAYFSLVLRSSIGRDAVRGYHSLNSHFSKNFSVYEKALNKARALNLSIPKRATRENVEKLSSRLESFFKSIKGWKSVHIRALAYLLIFDSQLDRNDRRNKKNGRWIHIEVHSRAIYYICVEAKAETDDILDLCISKDERASLVSCFREVSAGKAFSDAVLENQMSKSGQRELVRMLLEVDELRRGIQPLDAKQERHAIEEAAGKWNMNVDPQGALLRVRGCIHEPMLLEKMKICIKAYSKKSEQESVARKEKILHTLKANRNSKSSEWLVNSSFYNALFAFLCVLITCSFFFFTPQSAFSFGIAWWYFELGVLLAGSVAMSISLFLLLTKEKSTQNDLDITSLAGFTGLGLLLLWYVQPKTDHFGFAWWHAILGIFVSGVVLYMLDILTLLIRAIFLKVKLRVVFFEL